MLEVEADGSTQGEHDVGRLSSTRKRGSAAHHHHHHDGRATPDPHLNANIQSFGGLPEPPSPSFRITKASGASTTSTVRSSGRRSIGAKSIGSLFTKEPSLLGSGHAHNAVPPLPPPPSPSSRSIRHYQY